jgi:hypothetical protein
MLDVMSGLKDRLRENAVTMGLAGFAFVLLPLSVVAWNGGGSLEMRVQQWNALRQSIQSEDPAREAIDDADADSKLIENFLLPADGRAGAARARYGRWRSDREWWTVNVHLRSIDPDATGDRAQVVHEFEMKLLRDGRELERRRVEHIDQWERIERVWYLRDDAERVIEVLPPRKVDFITP